MGAAILDLTERVRWDETGDVTTSDGGEKDGLGASRLASHLSFGSFFNLAGVGSGATVT